MLRTISETKPNRDNNISMGLVCVITPSRGFKNSGQSVKVTTMRNRLQENIKFIFNNYKLFNQNEMYSTRKSFLVAFMPVAYQILFEHRS